MADPDRLLVSKIVATRDLATVLDANITPDFFDSPKGAKVYEFVLDHFKRHSEVPSVEAVDRNFPDYVLDEVEDALTYYIDLLRERREYSIVSEAVTSAGLILKEDGVAPEARVVLVQAMEHLAVEISSSRDVDLSQTQEERWALYMEYESLEGGMRGIHTGFASIDAATAGFQAEQMITFVGEPKSGKSAMMMHSAITAHNYGRVPVLMTFEMSAVEQATRYDAMRAGVNPLRLSRGLLKKDERRRLEQYLLRDSKNDHPFHMVADPTGSTVSAIAAKIGQYHPDILFVDGVYLMDDENGEPKGTPQALTNITRSLKKLAQTRRIPLCVSTQALAWKTSKKIGLTGASIGYTSSFLQDSDTIIGVEDTDNPDEKKIRVIASRNGPLLVKTCRWDWDVMEFEEFDEEFDDDDDDTSPF